MGELSILMLMTLLFGGSLKTSTGLPTEGSTWTYHGDLGPGEWYQTYPECNGVKQSPIDINTAEVKPVGWLKPFEFYNYPSDSASRTAATLMNDGHTASLALSDDWFVGGGNLKDRYQASEVRFHWGRSEDDKGAEHSINGYKHAMEIQMVFYATKYGSMNEAVAHRDGLAIIAVFADMSPLDNPKFDNLITSLYKISDAGSTSDVSAFRLTDYLPSDPLGYYHYNGSMTSPPCNENVMWFVMRERIPISKEQLDAFRTLKAGSPIESLAQRTMEDNSRPQQPLYDRTVYSSKPTLLSPLSYAQVTIRPHSIRKRAVFSLGKRRQMSPFRFSIRGGFSNKASPKAETSSLVVETKEAAEQLPVGQFIGPKKSVSVMNKEVQPIGSINRKSNKASMPSHVPELPLDNHLVKSQWKASYPLHSVNSQRTAVSSRQSWRSQTEPKAASSGNKWSWSQTANAQQPANTKVWSSGVNTWGNRANAPSPAAELPPPPPTELSKSTIDNFVMESANAYNRKVSNNVPFGAMKKTNTNIAGIPGNRISNTPKAGRSPSDPQLQFAVQPRVAVAPLRPITPEQPSSTPVMTTPIYPATTVARMDQPNAGFLGWNKAASFGRNPLTTSEPNTVTPTQPGMNTQSWQSSTVTPPNSWNVNNANQNLEHPTQTPNVQGWSSGQQQHVVNTKFSLNKQPQRRSHFWASKPSVQQLPERTGQSWKSGVAKLTDHSQKQYPSTQQAKRRSPNTWNDYKRNQAKQSHSASQAVSWQKGPQQNKADFRNKKTWNSGQGWQKEEYLPNDPKPVEQPSRKPQKQAPRPQPFGTQPGNSTEIILSVLKRYLGNGSSSQRYSDLWHVIRQAILMYKGQHSSARTNPGNKRTAQNTNRQSSSTQYDASAAHSPERVVQNPSSPDAYQYMQRENNNQASRIPSFTQEQVPVRSAFQKGAPQRSQYNQDIQSVNKINRGFKSPVSLSNPTDKRAPDAIPAPQDITMFTEPAYAKGLSTVRPHQSQPNAMNMPNSVHAEFIRGQPNRIQQYEPVGPASPNSGSNFDQIAIKQANQAKIEVVQSSEPMMESPMIDVPLGEIKTASPETILPNKLRKPKFNVQNNFGKFQTPGSTQFSGGRFSSHQSQTASSSSSSSMFSPKKSVNAWVDPNQNKIQPPQQQQSRQQQLQQQEQFMYQNRQQKQRQYELQLKQRHDQYLEQQQQQQQQQQQPNQQQFQSQQQQPHQQPNQQQFQSQQQQQSQNTNQHQAQQEPRQQQKLQKQVSVGHQQGLKQPQNNFRQQLFRNFYQKKQQSVTTPMQKQNQQQPKSSQKHPQQHQNQANNNRWVDASQLQQQPEPQHQNQHFQQFQRQPQPQQPKEQQPLLQQRQKQQQNQNQFLKHQTPQAQQPQQNTHQIQTNANAWKFPNLVNQQKQQSHQNQQPLNQQSSQPQQPSPSQTNQMHQPHHNIQKHQMNTASGTSPFKLKEIQPATNGIVMQPTPLEKLLGVNPSQGSLGSNTAQNTNSQNTQQGHFPDPISSTGSKTTGANTPGSNAFDTARSFPNTNNFNRNHNPLLSRQEFVQSPTRVAPSPNVAGNQQLNAQSPFFSHQSNLPSPFGIQQSNSQSPPGSLQSNSQSPPGSSQSNSQSPPGSLQSNSQSPPGGQQTNSHSSAGGQQSNLPFRLGGHPGFLQSNSQSPPSGQQSNSNSPLGGLQSNSQSPLGGLQSNSQSPLGGLQSNSQSQVGGQQLNSQSPASAPQSNTPVANQQIPQKFPFNMPETTSRAPTNQLISFQGYDPWSYLIPKNRGEPVPNNPVRALPSTTPAATVPVTEPPTRAPVRGNSGQNASRQSGSPASQGSFWKRFSNRFRITG